MEERLERITGISGLSLIILNYTIGAGIFVLPGIVGFQSGPPIAVSKTNSLGFKNAAISGKVKERNSQEVALDKIFFVQTKNNNYRLLYIPLIPVKQTIIGGMYSLY